LKTLRTFGTQRGGKDQSSTQRTSGVRISSCTRKVQKKKKILKALAIGREKRKKKGRHTAQRSVKNRCMVPVAGLESSNSAEHATPSPSKDQLKAGKTKRLSGPPTDGVPQILPATPSTARQETCGRGEWVKDPCNPKQRRQEKKTVRRAAFGKKKNLKGIEEGTPHTGSAKKKIPASRKRDRAKKKSRGREIKSRGKEDSRPPRR